MTIRALRVTDIRCSAPRCGAGPGENCRGPSILFMVEVEPERVKAHSSRIIEHRTLVRAGWQWQEVDPTDDGARRPK